MAENNNNWPLEDFVVPYQDEPHLSIVNHVIQDNNFELKTYLLRIVKHNKFFSSPTKDSNLHLSVFVQFADTLKSNDVDSEAIRLHIFPFSFREREPNLGYSLYCQNFIMTWNELKKAFLVRYFLPSKTAQLRNQIICFRKMDGESLFDAWERYKEIMRACPYHELNFLMIIHTFYNGFLYNMRMTIEASAGGTLMNKPFVDAYIIIESMA